MNNNFKLELIASYALNYLIYLQNAISNISSSSYSGNRCKFPYLNLECWELHNENIELQLKEVWIEIFNKISTNQTLDHSGIFEIEQSVFMKPFRKDPKGELGFRESWKSFTTWFDGYLGQYALENLIGNNLINDLYKKISPHSKSDKLMIIIVYDEVTLIDEFELNTTLRPDVYVTTFHQLNFSFEQTVSQIMRVVV